VLRHDIACRLIAECEISYVKNLSQPQAPTNRV